MSRETKRLVRAGCAFALALVLAAGCGGKDAGEKAAEKMAEKIIEHAGGKDMKVDIEEGKVTMKGDGYEMESSETTSWPDDMPGDVPRFKYGKVEQVTRTKHQEEGVRTCNIFLKDVDDDGASRYQSDLEKKGWETRIVDMGGKGGMIQAQKGENTVMVMFDKEERRANVMFAHK